MKIAIITDDGEKISAHFGSAPKCAVYEVVEGRIVGRELRDKPGHAHGHGHDHNHNHDDHDHDHQHGGHGRFQEKLAVMHDCQMVLARGMGHRAYENLQRAGLQPITTDIVDIETAVQAVINETIVDNPRRRH